MHSTTLEDRVILVLREAGEVYGMWKRLEDDTGIGAARWRKAYTSQQRPTPDMIEALCRLKPQYAFWIGTGITDAENGHKAPDSALPFPEWRCARESDWLAVEYFKMSLSLLGALALRGKTNLEDQGERLLAFGLQRVKRNWWASSLATAAAELTPDPAYKELKKLRELRESARGQASSTKAPPSGGRSAERVDPTTKQMKERDHFWSRPAS